MVVEKEEVISSSPLIVYYFATATSTRNVDSFDPRATAGLDNTAVVARTETKHLLENSKRRLSQNEFYSINNNHLNTNLVPWYTFLNLMFPPAAVDHSSRTVQRDDHNRVTPLITLMHLRHRPRLRLTPLPRPAPLRMDRPL